MSEWGQIRIDLLPPYATDWERRAVWAGPDYDVIVAAIDKLARLHDAQTCPVEYLPWLAWALSVDTWDADWPEATKRSVIAASWDVHRYKGTVFAVRRALEALDFEAHITEWFERTPQGEPGTFSVLLEGNDLDEITVALLRSAHNAVSRAKPVSRHFTFALRLEGEVPVYAGAVGTLGVEAGWQVDTAQRVEVEPPVYTGAVGALGVECATTVAVGAHTLQAHAQSFSALAARARRKMTFELEAGL